MHERYDLPKRRPATRTRKRVLLWNTSPWAWRRLKSVAPGILSWFCVSLYGRRVGGGRWGGVGVVPDVDCYDKEDYGADQDEHDFAEAA